MNTDGLNATEAECAAGRTAPRVSLADIKANIAGEFFNTADQMFPGAPVLPGMDLLTICILVLRNGFTIIGKSAPASRDNFDPVLGQKLAYEDAVRQVWPLMGYELRERLHRDAQPVEGSSPRAARSALGDRWRTSPSTSPRLSWTTLEIFAGTRAITEAPVVVLASEHAAPRIHAARLVLDALPRRSPPAVAA